jgi:tRNA nucleotidyltransferase/poly(A) polymerase
MEHRLPPLVERVRAALPADQEIYLVGGAVRDVLLNHPHHDFDFVLPSKAIATARKVANALNADFYPLDETRDAGRVLVEHDSERTTLDFIAFQGADIKADLAARDLTVNAMAIDLRRPDALIDPFGGAGDLLAKKLRAPSPTSFQADSVRVLRAVRLAASLHMTIDKDARQQMRAAAGSLASVSPERLRDELFRLLETPKLAASLRALDMLEALAPLFPELLALKDIEQSPPHAFDVFGHTLNVVDRLQNAMALLGPSYALEGASDLHGGLVVLKLGRYRQQLTELVDREVVPGRPRRALLLLATMFHDTGKASTRSIEAGGRVRFIGHEEVSAQLAVQRAKALHLSNGEIELLETMVRQHGRPFALTQTGEAPTRRAIYRFLRDCGEAGVDVCLLSLADFMGKYAADLPQDALSQHLDTLRGLLEAFFEKPAEIVSPQTWLNGDELMSELELSPGPQVGEILEALREAQAAGEVNSRAEAVNLARTLQN